MVTLTWQHWSAVVNELIALRDSPKTTVDKRFQIETILRSLQQVWQDTNLWQDANP